VLIKEMPQKLTKLITHSVSFPAISTRFSPS
jgi:hypothetical protein